MSVDTAMPHSEHDPHSLHDEAPHGTRRGYLTGFALSVVLTAVPFALVMAGLVTGSTAVLAILALALVQIVVHMVFFLHMNTKVEAGWSMLALMFTAVLVVITLAGSIWVMYHLNTNMMPMSSEAMSSAATGAM